MSNNELNGYIIIDEYTPISHIAIRGFSVELLREIRELAENFEADMYSFEHKDFAIYEYIEALDEIKTRYALLLERLSGHDDKDIAPAFTRKGNDIIALSSTKEQIIS